MIRKRLVILAIILANATADELAPTDIRTLDSVPEGNYLTILRLNGSDRRLNFEIEEGVGKCVRTDHAPASDASVSFEPLGNGVFMAFMVGEHLRATQFWVFRSDGRAEIKEVPDRGEKQIAIPVKGDSLEFPKPATVPDGHLLANLHIAGKAERLNFRVVDNRLTCVASTDASLVGMKGQFRPIGNRVFVVGLSGDNYRPTQFWVFDEKGGADIKEVPELGGDQQAIRVEDARLAR